MMSAMVNLDPPDEAELTDAAVMEGQTFAPTPPSADKQKASGRALFHRTPPLSLDGLRQQAANRYEGVLIAAARARQLNAKKTAMEERGMEEAAELKRLKMTSHALGELLTGKIDVSRRTEGL
jgi:DNA-directed RNA polymerase omega subunit